MDKQRKKQLKKYISWGMIVLLVLLLAVMPLIAGDQIPPDGPQASILNTKAETRTIETQLIGGGQLASNATEEITIPTEVKLTEYLVANGDIVHAGDAIAAVDKVSVLTALAEVQETLDYLAGELAAAANSTDADTVKAHAGGLVKILYGKKGDSVRDIMLQHGALATLSLDGRMAVEIPCSVDLKNGSTVTVILENGIETDGRVESSAGGKLVVSIADDGYDIGENATVSAEDGSLLGSGPLYIHNAWNATAYYGTISKVSAKEGDTLSAGKPLFQLDVGDYSGNFQILNAQRQEYEELMQELFRMYDSGLVTAPCDGIVTGVDDEGAFLLAAASAAQPWQAQWLSSITQESKPAYSILLLSNETPADPEDPQGPEDPQDPENPDPPEQPSEPEPPAAPVYTVTVGKVNEEGTVDLSFTYADITDLNTVPTTFTPTGATAVWPLTGLMNKDLTAYSGTATTGNILFQVTASDGSVFYVFAAVAAPSQEQTPGGMIPGDLSGMLSGMFGGIGGMSGMMGSPAPAFVPYSLDTITIASVTSQEEMTLEITVDEQDIASLYPGQQATVIVEALTGQAFPATISSVSNTGTNAGGSSKFTAKLTLSKCSDMLPGMHATAFLTLKTTEDVLTLPVAALVEEGTKTLVYTGYNEKEDMLTDPVEITTGVSDGEYVQILSGLNPGDTVYYAYYDTLVISNTVEPPRFGF